VRDYLAGFGLGCILVRPTGEVQVARNWGQPPVAAALWAQDQKTAWQVVRAIGEVQPSSVEAAVAEIRAAAVRVDAVLSEHSAVVARARDALARLDTKIELARQTGTLAFFNAEYRRRREAARAAGKGFMRYSTALARLRQLLAGAAAGAPVSDVVQQVFDKGFGCPCRLEATERGIKPKR
jgi:hypothetical protein